MTQVHPASQCDTSAPSFSDSQKTAARLSAGYVMASVFRDKEGVIHVLTHLSGQSNQHERPLRRLGEARRENEIWTSITRCTPEVQFHSMQSTLKIKVAAISLETSWPFIL
jgi:hypothetical protein